ncbi:hypothetical protein CA13_15990 [Planctomycetes bacterium CA13]|uniref:Beta-xylosidase C-terminal Concanavalin A-like domain-containing protein n=1 Tax=Novipirellula herctigrandis TaxID=2527986 RepID=A0A5C5YZL1_9BACT|nr:hypothetical protein CA13_15990 [Planctomycetes bacterium CA13]
MTNRFSTIALLGVVIGSLASIAWGQESVQSPKKLAVAAGQEKIIDRFAGSLNERWQWLRENKAGWRISESGLEVLIEPGNMWGASNDAKNILVQPLPDGWKDAVEVSVELSHHPKKRWEQANLVWYYSDSAMVKLGLEIEHGITNIVMGREEGDKTRTVVIIPYADPVVQLRLTVVGQEIRGYFRPLGTTDWTEAGVSTLPETSSALPPQVSLQFYQGEAGSNRWATVKWLEIKKL